MPVSALNAVSTSRNGVGAFILQCKKLELRYCDHGASSLGMRSFLSSRNLARFAASHPQIQLQISPQPNKHPTVRAEYINGREKVICVRNMAIEQIKGKLDLLRDSSGQQNKRVKGSRTVTSDNDSVRGIWDPFHISVTQSARASELIHETATSSSPSDLLTETTEDRTSEGKALRDLGRSRNLLADMAAGLNTGLEGLKMRRRRL